VAIIQKLNQGSLLQRTLVHIGTFLLGSVAFISLMSFMLVSIAKGLVPSPETGASASSGEEQQANGDTQAPASRGKASQKKKIQALARPSTLQQ